MVIPKNESETAEFKESSSDLNAILETVCAFSNSKGGRVYIGIRDNGEIVGVTIGKKTLEELSSFIRQNSSPKIYPQIEVKLVNTTTLIIISVEEGHEKPYLAKGTGFKRFGKTNVKLDINELEKQILKKHSQKIVFDGMVSDAEITDVDENTIKRFVEKAGTLRSQRFTSEKPSTILSNLHLIREGKILNGGILCFGKNVTSLLPQAAFRCAVFRNYAITNHQLIEGNIFEVIDKVEQFAINNIKRSYVIKGVQREDIFEYPIEAIREAVINAVVHRDYFSNACCYLSVHEDRLEIRNPGVLPEEVKLEDLKKPGHISLPRNRLIARVAFLFGYIEQFGTGTTKIVNLCRRSGIKDPVFSEKSGHFFVTFFSSKKELTKREESALVFLKNSRTSVNYAKHFRISQRMAINDLKHMQLAGFVTRSGKGKKTIYQLNK